MQIYVNGVPRVLDVEPDMPLLWVLRDKLNLKGTKISCGVGLCGACTVHVNGVAVRSCSQPVGDIAGAHVTTIENLAEADHPVIKAWEEHAVPQCGYCQPGFIMAVSSMLAEKPRPPVEEIQQRLTNICRCGTYARIRETVEALANAKI